MAPCNGCHRFAGQGHLDLMHSSPNKFWGNIKNLTDKHYVNHLNVRNPSRGLVGVAEPGRTADY